VIVYALRRLLLLVPVLWVVTTLVWVLLFALPGDPARLLAGQAADPAVLARVRADWGLADPPLVQYGNFIGRLARLDLGRSYLQGTPVAELLLEHLPASIILALTSMALALALGVGGGALAAARHGSRLDSALLALSLVSISTPVFWVGLMLVLLLASGHGLGWLPVSGYGDGPALAMPGGFVLRLPGLAHLALPSLTLAVVMAGPLLRLTRSTLLDVLGHDYVRQARARGLPRARVIGRHALRNALVPIITMAGMDLAGLLAGAIATESVFAWPGLGRTIVRAIHSRDLPVVEGGVVLLTGAFVVTTLAVDIASGWLDPRARAT
jgi:peptide/nickel transport system permease protein